VNTRNIGENSKFWSKLKILDKIRNFWSTFELFVQIRNFWSTFELFVQIRNFWSTFELFVQIRNFWSPFELLVKIRNFGQNSKFWAKFEIFGQHSKFWAKFEILINFLKEIRNFFGFSSMLILLLSSKNKNKKDYRNRSVICRWFCLRGARRGNFSWAVEVIVNIFVFFNHSFQISCFFMINRVLMATLIILK